VIIPKQIYERKRELKLRSLITYSQMIAISAYFSDSLSQFTLKSCTQARKNASHCTDTSICEGTESSTDHVLEN